MKITKSFLLACSLIMMSLTANLKAQCLSGYSEIIVHIIPDTYPNETSWDIRDSANTIVASGTINGDTICYPTGNLLHFNIYDSYGDGVCCGYGYGSYSIYVDGNLVATGGEFDYSETIPFNYPPGEISTLLLNTYQQLLDHCNNTSPLSAVQINALADTIKTYHLYLANSFPEILAAFDLIDCYDADSGPLFINNNTSGGFPNSPGSLDGLEYDRAIFTIQQELFDVLFTRERIAQYRAFLSGKKYLTSDYFPGTCPLPVDTNQIYTATVNASMPTDWGEPTAYSQTPSRKPTGYYLSPGSIGKIKVPEIMVNAGFKILVGAHPFSNTSINELKRFFRISNTFEITDTVTLIANPFGGGIYIITPYEASAGLQQIQLTNVVPAPFFSAKSWDMTTLSEWQNVQRHHPAPWADFESEKFMMQVPTSFIYNYNDPVTLMADWDARMDVVSDLVGYPHIRNNHILYVMQDVRILHPGYYGIGYPQINTLYDPTSPQNGNSSHWFLSPGAANMWESEFHELGHAQLMTKFPGESEALCNLLSCAIFNQLYDIDIDIAFGWSFDNQYWRGRDQAATNWMVTHNFRMGNPMDISNTTLDEVRYQHRGYGKYVEIAALFGWEALENYYTQVNLDYNNGITPEPESNIDDRILKLSLAAGTDLRPLIHFWGVHPQDNESLAQAMANNNLPASPLICNRLEHYKSIIPMNNEQFNAHAIEFFNGPVPPGGNPDYGNGWYNVWLPQYNSSHGDSALVAMQNIIDTYFPNGCPCENVVISGSSSVCINGAEMYSVPDVTGATYLWTVTGGTIVSGQGTNSIQVMWNNGITGSVSIEQINP